LFGRVCVRARTVWLGASDLPLAALSVPALLETVGAALQVGGFVGKDYAIIGARRDPQGSMVGMLRIPGSVAVRREVVSRRQHESHQDK
jgi:hypothetical protein